MPSSVYLELKWLQNIFIFWEKAFQKKTWKLTWHWKQPFARCISCQVSFMEDNVLKYIGAHTLSNSSGLVAALVSYGNIVKSQCFIVVDHLVNIPRMIRVSNHLQNAYYLGSSTIRKGWLDRQGMQQVVVVLFSNDVLILVIWDHPVTWGLSFTVFLQTIYGKNWCICK